MDLSLHLGRDGPALVFGYARWMGDAWGVAFSHTYKVGCGARTRRQALEKFRDELLPHLGELHVVLLIYDKLWHLDAAWYFHGGRKMELNVDSWKKTMTGDLGPLTFPPK